MKVIMVLIIVNFRNYRYRDRMEIEHFGDQFCWYPVFFNRPTTSVLLSADAICLHAFLD